ncbi:MAG: hypothetical protein ACRDTD_24355, partial [Pseudonocardiaceae bacterium]
KVDSAHALSLSWAAQSNGEVTYRATPTGKVSAEFSDGTPITEAGVRRTAGDPGGGNNAQAVIRLHNSGHRTVTGQIRNMLPATLQRSPLAPPVNGIWSSVPPAYVGVKDPDNLARFCAAATQPAAALTGEVTYSYSIGGEQNGTITLK